MGIFNDVAGKKLEEVAVSSNVETKENMDAAGKLAAIDKAQAIIEFNLDGTVITANTNFLSTLGYSLAEIEGQHHSMFVDPSYKASAEYQQFWAKLNRGEYDAGEYKRIAKGGKEIWIQASYNPIHDAEGKVYKVVKFATDITEEKLRNADATGKLGAIDKAQAIIEFDLDGTILAANTNFLSTLGYSLAEIEGQHHSMFVDPSYKASAEYQQFWAKLNRGEYDAGEYKRIGKGGKEIWIQASYNPIHDAEGKVYKVVKFATDITEQKLRAAVDAANGRVKSALDVATSSVMMADADNNIIYTNESVVKMLRAAESDIRKDLPSFSTDKVLGSNVDIFHKNPAHQQGMLSALKDTHKTEIVVGGRTFALVANPVFDDKNERLATVVEWEDISERLEREKLDHEKELQESIIAGDNARIKSALDAVTSSVMMADADNNIIYTNESVMNMLRAAETDIRKDLPNFSVATVMGSNIDIFHKNPAHQQNMLSALRQTYKTEIVVGGRTFALVANPVFDGENNRLATVVEWEDISERLEGEEQERVRVEQDNKLATENARIKSALDTVSSNVMMADADNVIIYTNAAVMNMLRKAESDIRQALPNFSSDKVLGSSVDIFHKNPAHQKNMLNALKGEYRTEIKVGVRTFSLIANPVFDADGERQGTVVEWNDRTEELSFEDIVDNTISSAVSGELSTRIDLAGREGFIAKISTGINQLLDIFENVLKDAAASISELAEGRLTRKIDTDYQGSYDELKADINQTIDKLVEVVSEISQSGASVKEAAGEISSGNTNLSQRTEEQAASLEETSAAMEEITTTVQQNAANAVQANTLARGARETAENGGAVVGTAISAMEAISESSNKINDIIGVIDEIAFQTNLLALNAAVEAARAGDQGRGFAVVADEVRSLAGRSATAAKEIKELIKDSSEKVQEGSDLVNKSGSTLDEIVTAVKKVNDIVAEISTASDEQATGLDEINKAMGEMDEMTQQNAALVEEAAAASEAMGNQAENLDELISFFDTGARMDRSSKRSAAPKPAAAPQRKASVTKPSPAKAQKSSSDEGKDWSEF